MSFAQIQERLHRNLSILAVGIFALLAVDYAERGGTVMVTILAIMAALNLLAFLMSRFIGPFAAALMSLFNGVAAAFVGFTLFVDGKLYLPYIWLGVAIIYLVATVVALIRAAREKNQ